MKIDPKDVVIGDLITFRKKGGKKGEYASEYVRGFIWVERVRCVSTDNYRVPPDAIVEVRRLDHEKVNILVRRHGYKPD